MDCTSQFPPIPRNEGKAAYFGLRLEPNPSADLGLQFRGAAEVGSTGTGLTSCTGGSVANSGYGGETFRGDAWFFILGFRLLGFRRMIFRHAVLLV